MRLHSVILAWKLNMPTIGLSYDPKVSNFCNENGIPVIDLSSTEQVNNNSNLLKNLLINDVSTTNSSQPEYLTPKLFNDFWAQTHRRPTLTLSQALLIEKKYYSLLSQYNDIVNSRAYRLISLYYRFVNWIKRPFA
ncbi:MAG: hypothetical protein GXO48_06955 [Chlorobi bacterium]|nr:hypothetical protein [Chlorobiota bacterium]